jgi:hypothetical protein
MMAATETAAQAATGQILMRSILPGEDAARLLTKG